MSHSLAWRLVCAPLYYSNLCVCIMEELPVCLCCMLPPSFSPPSHTELEDEMFNTDTGGLPPIPTLPKVGWSGEEVVAAATKVLGAGKSGCCHSSAWE